MEQEIVNKVAQSQLTTLNPFDFLQYDIQVFDLKDFLFMEMILKEKEFRSALKDYDWTGFSGKYVTVDCTSEAIIPRWAYMLVAAYLQPFAQAVFSGNKEMAIRQLFLKTIENNDWAEYKDKRIILKGCSDASIPEYAYLELTRVLMPYAKSIMYGEACSSVPVFKRK